MQNIYIDCSTIVTGRELHEKLAQALSFPDWYGYNLDALFDLLSTLPVETDLTLLHFSSLPAFSAGFRKVLTDSALHNPNLNVIL